MAVSAIDLMRKSDKKLLLAEAADIERWKGLRHNKSGLEMFLQFNIAEIRFKYKNSSVYTKIICTSNTRLINVINAVKKSQKVKMMKTPFDGIRTNDTTSILTYDLSSRTYKTVSLKAWEIMNFISITPDNIELIDNLINQILKAKIIVENNNKRKNNKVESKK